MHQSGGREVMDKTVTVRNTSDLLALRGDDGVIRASGNLRIECDIPFSVGKQISGISVEGYLHCGGNLHCGGDYLIITGDLYWSQAHIPLMPERRYIKRVLPPESQRAHWQDRLGMDISNVCYEQICRAVLKQIIDLLEDEKWTPTERWMLEVLRDSGKEPPEWVGIAGAGK